MKSFIEQFIPDFLLSWYHLGLAVLGAVICRFPSKKLIVIGVTGTNGKSTVVMLTTKILEEAGHKTASLSSIKFKIGDNEWPNTLKMTMPGRFKLQKFLRDAVNAGCTHAVIEVTSEGIKQWRHWGIDFDVAVFTNLTKEHIESHGSFEKYRNAKGKLFRSLRRKEKQKTVSIVNIDDDNADYFLQFPADEKYTYSYKAIKLYSSKAKNLEDELSVSGHHLFSSGVKFRVDDTEFHLKLYGRFNIYNALAAISVGLSQGIDLGIIKKALGKVEGVPGRFEIIQKKPFTVIVDYAHTPDALKNVYETIQESGIRNQELGKLICVLGAAGGGRDKWKRPELGKIAGEECDYIVLSNEDPYDEDPGLIIQGIEAGFSQAQAIKHRHITILDRKEGIRRVLSFAQAGDCVVITGKGSEPWMMVAGGKRIPWDDREVTRKELKRLD